MSLRQNIATLAALFVLLSVTAAWARLDNSISPADAGADFGTRFPKIRTADLPSMTIVEGATYRIPFTELWGLQPADGAIEVAMKSAALKQAKQEKSRPEYKKFLREFRVAKAAPVIYSQGRFFIVDHNHAAYALYENGVKFALVQVRKTWEHASLAEFHAALLAKNDRLNPERVRYAYLHLISENRDIPFSELPGTVPQYKNHDEVFRSLAGAVRDAGGFFDNTGVPFAEFYWGEYLRTHFEPNWVRKHFKQAVALARKLVHLDSARRFVHSGGTTLPGFSRVPTNCEGSATSDGK